MDHATELKLRNAHLAVVDRGKGLDYLLKRCAPDNGGKGQFFVNGVDFIVSDVPIVDEAFAKRPARAAR